MIKLRELIDEKKYVDNAYNRSKDRVGAEWGSDKGDGKKKDKKSKEDEPKQAGLGVVGINIVDPIQKMMQ